MSQSTKNCNIPNIQCSMILLQTHPFAFYLIPDIILHNFGEMVVYVIADKDIRLVGFGNWMHLQLVFPRI
ncbi:hypothetical protein DAPPUDRAFT_336214 [Daphnia pulex]|uniref:Uncharacterized protein n=1 Tax=Daphnia pulex TaxID=6669 RepID=E9HZB6_DAPPU|nr:hypothetical protein DAPPUDRAFT_336214 [Daphnia pulex]|eukprot:EFX62914.1 hypothetical protein DAPPUDRAFT_336214 [Daphnia pulex]